MDEISDEAIKRMELLVRRMADLEIRPFGVYLGLADPGTLIHAPVFDYMDAQAIVELLPAPVDPDLIEARQLSARVMHQHNVSDVALRSQILNGEADDNPGVIAVLAGIKRGRELNEQERGKK